MATWQVVNRKSKEVVYAYTSDDPIEWPGMEFSLFNHIGTTLTESEPQIEWKIFVGAFFDRFGDYRLAVLSSQDPIIKAFILDASVRKYIDLTTRAKDLRDALTYIVAQGFPLDIEAILTTEPVGEELWQQYTL